MKRRALLAAIYAGVIVWTLVSVCAVVGLRLAA